MFARNLPTVSVMFVGLDNKEETIEGEGHRIQCYRLPLYLNMRARNCLPLTTALTNSFGIVINFEPIKKKTAGKKSSTFSILNYFFFYHVSNCAHCGHMCISLPPNRFFIFLIFILMHNPRYFTRNPNVCTVVGVRIVRNSAI